MHHTDWSSDKQRLPLRVPWNGMEAVCYCSVVPFHRFLLCAENCASSSLQPEWGFWGSLGFTLCPLGTSGDETSLKKGSLLNNKCEEDPSTTADGLVPQRMNRSPVLWSQTVTSGMNPLLTSPAPPCLFLQLLPYSPLQTQLRTGSSPQGLLFLLVPQALDFINEQTSIPRPWRGGAEPGNDFLVVSHTQWTPKTKRMDGTQTTWLQRKPTLQFMFEILTFFPKLINEVWVHLKKFWMVPK